ncbi:MAG: hypothetical protein MPK62_08170, partial [Alphaproteobacteria bacterium]|nr:hypothetical protein [Alphaproteobacteria bacterium]
MNASDNRRRRAGMSSSSDWTSRAERPGDGAAIESLLDRSFGTDRKVARISYRFREGRAPLGELCRVAESGEGAILACARAWDCLLYTS